MKRYFYVFFSVFVFSAFTYADDFDVNGFSIGGGGLLTADLSGGFVDIGFNIFSHDLFFIRNYIEINGAGYSSGDLSIGFFGIRERLIIGSIIPITENFAARGYGGADVGFSFYGGSVKRGFWDSPYILEARGFGGIEFLFDKDDGVISTFIEGGSAGRFSIVGNGNISDVGISVVSAFVNFGGRYYFN